MNELMTNGPVEVVPRADAPYDLTDEEADVWRGIVNAMPGDHFMPGNFALLAQLCRHTVASKRLAQLIKACCEAKPFCHRDYGALLTLQNAESASIMRLSRSMRLTQQSTMKAESVKHPRGMPTKAPWDRE